MGSSLPASPSRWEVPSSVSTSILGLTKSMALTLCDLRAARSHRRHYQLTCSGSTRSTPLESTVTKTRWTRGSTGKSLWSLRWKPDQKQQEQMPYVSLDLLGHIPS